MSNIYQHWFVLDAIPTGDVTPLENACLSQIFTLDQRDGYIYLLGEDSVNETFDLDITTLPQLIDHPDQKHSWLWRFICDTYFAEITKITTGKIEIDLTDQNWLTIFQDIVKRSQSLESITIKVFTVGDKLRSSTFGFSLYFITSSTTYTKDEGQILQHLKQEAISLDDITEQCFTDPLARRLRPAGQSLIQHLKSSQKRRGEGIVQLNGDSHEYSTSLGLRSNHPAHYRRYQRQPRTI